MRVEQRHGSRTCTQTRPSSVPPQYGMILLSSDENVPCFPHRVLHGCTGLNTPEEQVIEEPRLGKAGLSLAAARSIIAENISSFMLLK